jgi:hypothetical protein
MTLQKDPHRTGLADNDSNLGAAHLEARKKARRGDNKVGKPQRVSAMFWQIFRVNILWGVVHGFSNVDAERREHVEDTSL